MRPGRTTRAAVRTALDDAVRALREWRPPERVEVTEERRAERPPRRPEPTWGRSEPARMVRRGVQDRVLFPALVALGRPETTGAHHLDAVRPPFILAPNHVSHADTPLVLRALPAWLRERTVVPAAADYFFDRRWLSVAVTLGLNAVPFDRRYDIADSVRRCERHLRHGYSILLFPEGSRSRDGRLRGFKAGVAHLAVQTGAPVIPVYVQGTHGLLPRGAMLPRPAAVAVHFGAPMQALPDEPARAFNERLEAQVLRMADRVRGHAHRDEAPRRAGWRELWLRDRVPDAPLHGGAVPRGAGRAAADPEKGWIDRWRATTPR